MPAAAASRSTGPSAAASAGTGYRGRVGIYELLVTTEEIRQLAPERMSAQVLKKRPHMRSGMNTFATKWLAQKVLLGRTTVEEVTRVAKAD